MNVSAIEAKIHTFIRDECLGGQAEGLLSTTPLLELGILESFALFRLVAYLNTLYTIDIKPEEIVGRHFRNIECIANLVLSKTGNNGVHPASTPPSPPVGVAIFEAPSCAQVFLMFSGLGRDTPEFFNLAGIGNRNILIFHDASSQSYRHGISPDLPSPAAICQWIGTWINNRPHIEEVYCIGVSSGGLMAMRAGNYLKAKTAWVFAARTARRNIVKDTLDQLTVLVERATGKKIRELMEAMTPEDQGKIDLVATPELVDEYHKNLLDPARFLDEEYLLHSIAALGQWNGSTDYRVYYVPRDSCDAKVAEALKQCRGVTLVPVAPSDPPQPAWAFSRWIPPVWWVSRDHLVVELLQERGDFQPLFPEFRSVESGPLTLAKKSIA